MYISHKANVIKIVHETEWQCRRKTKGLDKPEYWAWLDSVTDSDGVVDLSGETGYTMVECTDEKVQERLLQLNDYISVDGVEVERQCSQRCLIGLSAGILDPGLHSFSVIEERIVSNNISCDFKYGNIFQFINQKPHLFGDNFRVPVTLDIKVSI